MSPPRLLGAPPRIHAPNLGSERGRGQGSEGDEILVLLEGCTADQLELMASIELQRMKAMQAYIGLRGGENVSELGGVPAEEMRLRDTRFRALQDYRVNHTRWCVLRQPNASMAQLPGMSTDAFEDCYFRVCNLDYARMSAAMDSLVALMVRTERVRITGPAPTWRSRSPTSPPSSAVLDTDDGARFLGEFSLGLNPFISAPMKDALFDEKIRGSLHLALGNAYDECDNGNESAIHWDLVLIQRPEFGGGEVLLDGRVIRRDGLFVVPELEGLNPDRLG